jgi:hypothetical protein
MLDGNVRSSLTRDDAELALRLIARGSESALAAAEAVLRDGGIDALLDDERLVPAMVHSRAGMHASLPLFFCAVVRRAFAQSEEKEKDHALADYVADVLIHFAARGRAERVSEADDETYDTLAALAADVNIPDGRRSFLVRQHLGNYALWLSGLFPDRIEQRRWRRGGPSLDYYDELGKRGFALAAEHRVAHEHGLEPLLHRAAERFVMVRVALNRVSDTLLFPNVSTPERLMRQVRDEGRWRKAS